MIYRQILGKPFIQPAMVQTVSKPFIYGIVAVVAHENKRTCQARKDFLEKGFQQMGVNENDLGLLDGLKLFGALHRQIVHVAAKQAESNRPPMEIFVEPADGIG